MARISCSNAFFGSKLSSFREDMFRRFTLQGGFAELEYIAFRWLFLDLKLLVLAAIALKLTLSLAT